MDILSFIFDVDGTLVDTNRLHAEAWEGAFQSDGFSVTAEQVLPQIGKGSDKLVPSLVGEVSDERYDKLRQASAKRFERIVEERGIRPFPRAKELLEALRKRGLRLAIATSAKRSDFDKIVKVSGLDLPSLVDELVTGDDVERTKPEPEIVSTAIDALKVPPNACVLVGDTPYDAEATVRAGARCFGVLTGIHDDEAMRKAGASRSFRDVAALEAALDSAIEALSLRTE